MPPRSDIEVIDRPTVLSILYSAISVQQMNLLPENASQNGAIFLKVDMAYIRPLCHAYVPMVAQSSYYIYVYSMYTV